MRTMIFAAVLMAVAVGCEQGQQPAPQAQTAPQRDTFLVGPSGETEWEVTLTGDTNCKGWMSLAIIEPYGCGAAGQAGHWACSNETIGFSGYLSGHAIGGVENMTLTKGGAPVFTLSGSYDETLILGVIPELGASFRAERR